MEDRDEIIKHSAPSPGKLGWSRRRVGRHQRAGSVRFVRLLFGAVNQRHRSDGDCCYERTLAIDGQSINHERDNGGRAGDDAQYDSLNDSDGGDGAADICDDIGYRGAASRGSKRRGELQSADGHAEHLGGR